MVKVKVFTHVCPGCRRRWGHGNCNGDTSDAYCWECGECTDEKIEADGVYAFASDPNTIIDLSIKDEFERWVNSERLKAAYAEETT